MALKPRAMLGVELHPDEIRVVELRPRGTGVSVSNLLTFSPPQGYIVENGMFDPLVTGKALAAKLERGGFTATEAVFGLPAACCVFRAVSVPPVDGKDLYSIVRGELEHARAFREPGGSVDVMDLEDGRSTDQAGRNVLAMGAEYSVLESLRQMAKAAGLKIAAVEPTHVALYRASLLQTPNPSNLFLTLSETDAQIWLLNRGKLALHRSFAFGNSIFEPTEDVAGVSSFLNADVASTVALEIRRSVDYILRELPHNPPMASIPFAFTHELAPLMGEWLGAALGIELIPSTVTGFPSFFGIESGTMNEIEACHYLGACGLALRDPFVLPIPAPTIDLLASEREQAVELDEAMRKFRIAMMASCAVLACGVLTATLGTIRARSAADDLVRSQKKLGEVQAVEKARMADAEQRTERLKLLSAQGVPVSSTIQAITRTLPASVGLTEVKMTPVMADVAGEALSEQSIIAMSDALRHDVRFGSVSLTSFERVTPEKPAEGMRFRMNLLSSTPPPSLTAVAAKSGGGS